MTSRGRHKFGIVSIKPPAASRQVTFHQLLVAARKTLLMDALSAALGRVNPTKLKAELATYIPRDTQRILAAAGIRDEHVFPTPIILETGPMLVGYYRLLLGIPQKTFYVTDTGMSQFKSMEARGVLNDRQKAALPAFCKAMSEGLADLVRQMSPTITPRDVAELPLLTIGAQFQGSNNNTIGKRAILDVFLSIREVVKGYITKEDDRGLTLRNSAGANGSYRLGQRSGCSHPGGIRRKATEQGCDRDQRRH